MLTVESPLTGALRAINDRNAAIVRDCLDRWVSELEPIVVWFHSEETHCDYIGGLTALNDPDGTIYVRARLWMH